jgi:DNA-binding response OmpR family regulator
MKRRVLLVEDDELLSELLEMLLVLEGFDVVHAGNGAEALERLSQHDVDLIVLDLMMPVLDGLGFLQQLPESAGKRPPVLVFSASTSAEVIERARLAGAAAVTRKPVDQKEFMALVRDLVSR